MKFSLLVAPIAVAVAAWATGCRDQAPAPASALTPTTATASTVPQTAGPLVASTSASSPSAVTAPPIAPFAAEKITGEGHAMGTHLSFAAYTAPRLDAAAIRSAFDAATAE